MIGSIDFTLILGLCTVFAQSFANNMIRKRSENFFDYYSFFDQSWKIEAPLNNERILINSVYNNISLADFTSSQGILIYGAGGDVAGAGDVNLDGYADFLVYGSNLYSYVIYGGANLSSLIDLSTLSSTQGFSIYGGSDCVCYAGDVNGDNYSDVMVANSGGADTAGITYVIYGGSSLESTDALSLESSQGFSITGGGDSGPKIRSAGDVNNDGYDDVIIGAPPPYNVEGTSYVVLGQSSNSDINFNYDLSISSGFSVHGISYNDDNGCSVSGVGDVNGDGYNDIISGACGVNSNTGASYIIYGSASPVDIQLPLSSSEGFTVSGASEGDSSGYSVSAAGDVNADGFSDIIIGAPQCVFGSPCTGTGLSYVIFGSETPVDIQLPPSLPEGFTVTGSNLYGATGYSVSAAGDFNGDGYDDVIIGSPYSFDSEGAIYIIFGASSLSDIQLPPTSSQGITITGPGSNANCGIFIGAAGDINGDSFSDILIGCLNSYAYVIFGASFPTSQPTSYPSTNPSYIPTIMPSSQPSAMPTKPPSSIPSSIPSCQPSSIPTSQPSGAPTMLPTDRPSFRPSSEPSRSPTSFPNPDPTSIPTSQPTAQPSFCPSAQPSGMPSSHPSENPSSNPTTQPTDAPTSQPTGMPTTPRIEINYGNVYKFQVTLGTLLGFFSTYLLFVVTNLVMDEWGYKFKLINKIDSNKLKNMRDNEILLRLIENNDKSNSIWAEHKQKIYEIKEDTGINGGITHGLYQLILDRLTDKYEKIEYIHVKKPYENDRLLDFSATFFCFCSKCCSSNRNKDSENTSISQDSNSEIKRNYDNENTTQTQDSTSGIIKSYLKSFFTFVYHFIITLCHLFIYLFLFKWIYNCENDIDKIINEGKHFEEVQKAFSKGTEYCILMIKPKFFEWNTIGSFYSRYEFYVFVNDEGFNENTYPKHVISIEPFCMKYFKCFWRNVLCCQCFCKIFNMENCSHWFCCCKYFRCCGSSTKNSNNQTVAISHNLFYAISREYNILSTHSFLISEENQLRDYLLTLGKIAPYSLCYPIYTDLGCISGIAYTLTFYFFKQFRGSKVLRLTYEEYSDLTYALKITNEINSPMNNSSFHTKISQVNDINNKYNDESKHNIQKRTIDEEDSVY